MKSPLIILALFTFQFSYGQHYLGIEIAPGLQTITNTNGLQVNPKSSIRSGLHYGYRFNASKPWGIESSLYYNQRGYRINDLTFARFDGTIVPADFMTTFDNIGVNLLFKAQRNFLYASIGPSLEYNISIRQRIEYHDKSLEDTKYTNSPSTFSDAIYFGYEANVGTQFFLTEQLQCFAELSFNQVFSRKFEISQTRTGLLNVNIGLGINYLF